MMSRIRPALFFGYCLIISVIIAAGSLIVAKKTPLPFIIFAPIALYFVSVAVLAIKTRSSLLIPTADKKTVVYMTVVFLTLVLISIVRIFG